MNNANPAVDLTILSELIQQLALAQAANQAARANGGASAAPTASMAPVPVAANLTTVSTQAALNANTGPIASNPAGYFRCPNCNILHPLVIIAAGLVAALAHSG